MVIVEGGRATGKSTMCDRLAAAHGWAQRIDLSDDRTRDTLRLDPVRFLEAQATPCVVDEAQVEPQLPMWVKHVIDRRPGTGQFLLTGSARLRRDQLAGSDPLAGRAIRLRMWSFVDAELIDADDDLLVRAFGSAWDRAIRFAAAEREQRLGGLPSIPGVLAEAATSEWSAAIGSYVDAALPLAVGGSRVDIGRLLRTFRYLAAQSGAHLNLARAASELAMKSDTVRDHLEMLESAFLLHRVEGHRPSEHRVVTAHPKVLTTDVGLAVWAMRAEERPVDAAEQGAIAETIAGHRLAAAADAHPHQLRLRHWRDRRAQREVDFLVCHPDGSYLPVEVKASQSVGPADVAGIRSFFKQGSHNCPRGLVLYAGSQVVDLTHPGEPEILAVPLHHVVAG